MLFSSVLLSFVSTVGLAAVVTPRGPAPSSLEARAAAGDRLVFCHFMIGIVGDRTSAADYDDDMRRAKEAGIDAFALNIGVDGYTDQQLNYAYESAARNDMKVFISFDFNWYSPGNAAAVGSKIAQYASKPAQLLVNDRVFASSFAGDGLDVDAVRAAAGTDVFFVPNFHPGQGSLAAVDGAFNWMAWPNDGNNKAPKPGKSLSVADGDNAYLDWLGDKTYMAPISPWFFTHFGPEVSFSKNWVFPGGSLIFDRWNEVLQKGFPMVELITWNDYGESHYIGPLSSPHYDDGNSKWTNDMPHNGWLDLSKPFIAAYKNKDTSVDKYITDDQIIYWYRRTLGSLDCDATDTTAGRPANNDSGNYFQGRPDGWQTLEDAVYVVTLLTEPGTLTIASGDQVVEQEVPAGANLVKVPAAVGKQRFSLSRGGTVVLQDTSLMDISNVCPCGLYNFNAYVGTVPAGFNDPLGEHGLASLTIGLHVTTCSATPSLGTNPPTTATTTATASTTTAGPITTSTTSTTSTSSGTTSAPSPSKTTSEPTQPTSTSEPDLPCNGGTNADGETGNYAGLCSFACSYGYCPPGPCKCTSRGTPGTPPPPSGRDGCPLPGEGDGYKGLCSFACSHGYCPETACQYC
ncbi:glycoside hydrolase family 71 protein [Thermothelomyces thermophilus ATCC 42464]|uniref:Glycoside hydrolase family 71 protein n=1 Tax=Thermothelomyces thermophilus (strain ATCC 42464 / BCRC 31852 / DSM 1799) TaxID=573729 RepID=G2QMP5_THET4|nr:glycoside hydrolase family 71 protein [Thermothelomyces thermophilus ATCC 42464]AEO61225.1 glycoside hydrolase family 71 protein [Thermothelomyces thermophilus ATCC 42464]